MLGRGEREERGGFLALFPPNLSSALCALVGVGDVRQEDGVFES